MPNTSNSNLQLFSYENKEIRTNTINGEPWWVAKDVCDILNLSDVSMSVAKLDEDEKLVQTFFVSGQNRDMMTVNESGLYALIIRSNKPEAKTFRKWVTSVVLPQIRKTGRYSIDEDLESRRIKNECKAILEAIYNATLPGSSITIRSLIDEITTKSIEDYRDPVKRLLCKHGIRVELENKQWVLWLANSHRGLSNILQSVESKWGNVLKRIPDAIRGKKRFSSTGIASTGIPLDIVKAIQDSQYSNFSETVQIHEGQKKVNLVLKSKDNRAVTVVIKIG